MLFKNFKIKKISFFIFFLCLVPIAFSSERESRIFFREDFNTLEHWMTLPFPKIKKQTVYTIEKDKNNKRYLKTESNASASALIYEKGFDVYKYPKIRWRWKIENVYKKSDPKKKEGDDYPLRVYIIFKYDPQKAGFFEKLQYSVIKKIYGEYPPKSSLNYVWASKRSKDRTYPSPYTKKTIIIALEDGNDLIGKWVTEEVNIIHDYERAFGEKTPEQAGIAIMNDSDNTGEKSVSYIDFIELFSD